jgi:hypothetical protein
MAPILLLHSFRHLGLLFLTPGSLRAVVQSRPTARVLVWTFNVEGSLDLINATVLATLYGAPVYMGPAYWIPAFWVPALLVTHDVTFVVLRNVPPG